MQKFVCVHVLRIFFNEKQTQLVRVNEVLRFCPASLLHKLQFLASELKLHYSRYKEIRYEKEISPGENPSGIVNK